MACLTLTDARNLMLQGRPWTFRIVSFPGRTWTITGRARREPVEIIVTHNGATLGINRVDWDYVEKKVPEQIANGWDYAATPYVRVRQETIDDYMASLNPAPIPVNPTPVNPASQGPWSRIQVVTKGLNGWEALDAQGRKVLDVTLRGARDLCTSFPHIHVQGL